eukprot:jgi/Botrbrau1/22903/Bobra.0065s0055.1
MKDDMYQLHIGYLYLYVTKWTNKNVPMLLRYKIGIQHFECRRSSRVRQLLGNYPFSHFSKFGTSESVQAEIWITNQLTNLLV